MSFVSKISQRKRRLIIWATPIAKFFISFRKILYRYTKVEKVSIVCNLVNLLPVNIAW